MTILPARSLACSQTTDSAAVHGVARIAASALLTASRTDLALRSSDRDGSCTP